MDLPPWQERVAAALTDAPLPAKVPFVNAKKFFAVDASGSTFGPIMKAQAKIVWGLRGGSDDTIAKWSYSCELPRLLDSVPLDFFYGTGGTQPASILRNVQAVDAIRSSDLWILLTDGQIDASSVAELTRLAEAMDVLQVPVVLVITGHQKATPAQTAISVGIPFYASAREALILFKDCQTGQIALIDAKGCFAPLKMDKAPDLSSWQSLKRYASEEAFNKYCGELAIELVQGKDRLSSRAVSLGPEWDTATTNVLVNVPILLEQKQLRLVDLRNLLGEEAINQLALICKTRGQLGVLRDLIMGHKQQEIMVRLEDRHGALKVVEKLQSDDVKPEEREQLMNQLRQAHKANRETYEALRDSPSEKSRRATEINRLIDRALRIISDFEKSSYTADILDRRSNRAMRAEVVSDADSSVHLASLDLSSKQDSFKGTCAICCGEEQVMSIVLKKLATVEDNTTDFALNFPLAAGHAKQNADMVSSQCICFQCALLLSPKSIYQEDIVAVIPTIQYQDQNKKYINHQLTLAVTNGLATGASGIVQLFMTVLDKTLATKAWCSTDFTEDDSEVALRRELLTWMLRNLLRRCKCRENFTETGDFVDYPRALIWAVKDYEEARLDSWIIQYSVVGFNQLIRWYEELNLPVDQESLEAIKKAKLVHLTVATIMVYLLVPKDEDRSWTHPFLQLVYREFNAPGVPRDISSSSITLAEAFWTSLHEVLGCRGDVRRFLASFKYPGCLSMVHNLQLIIFWALYTQKGHTTPKTFFATIKAREPLAAAILDPTAIVPTQAVNEVLLSIFCPKRQIQEDTNDPHLSNELPPFASAFGPSVIHCGTPGCTVQFYIPSDLEPGVNAADQIRDRRAKHFREVYGVADTFNSLRGLPEPTKAPNAPSSYHNTLHISTARVWSRLDLARKKAVVHGISDKDNLDVLTFLEDVRIEIAKKSHRGNIYSSTIDTEVRAILPSLLEALKVASEKLGLVDKSGLGFVYDWEGNRVEKKLEYELSLKGDGCGLA